jgi:hypothetical protein
MTFDHDNMVPRSFEDETIVYQEEGLPYVLVGGEVHPVAIGWWSNPLWRAMMVQKPGDKARWAGPLKLDEGKAANWYSDAVMNYSGAVVTLYTYVNGKWTRGV